MANAKLAGDWFAALPRFKKARMAAGVSLEELARRLDLINFSIGMPKDLKAIEDGKNYPGTRAVANLIHELGICEAGSGRAKRDAGRTEFGVDGTFMLPLNPRIRTNLA